MNAQHTTADPREASRVSRSHRADAWPAGGATTPGATDGAAGGTAGVPRHAAPPAAQIAAAAAPAFGKIASPGAGEDGFGAESLGQDAGLGESRLSPRPPVTGPVAILHAPETPRAVVLQIVEILRASGERAVELRLQPEELGRLHLTMSQDASGTLTVALSAERAETLDLLRRNIDLLGADLRDLGYENVDFSFHGDGAGSEASSGTARGGPSRGHDADGGASGSADPPKSGDGRVDPSHDGIDIRL